MKNSLRLGFLAITITICFAACKGKGSTAIDSTKTDSVKKASLAKKTTNRKPDSVLVDLFDKNGKKVGSKLMAIPKDTTKKDTTKKK